MTRTSGIVDTHDSIGPFVSADSHVMEPARLLADGLPARFRDQAWTFPEPDRSDGFHEGGSNPRVRLGEMAIDGVGAEILYPTSMLKAFALKDEALQQACFRVYNDWLVEYCSAAPDRLIGVPLISVYDIDAAVAELERCRDMGMRGAQIWQAPHADLPLSSPHYDRFWRAAADMRAAVSLHILTGLGYSSQERTGIELYRGSVNLKLHEAANALFDLIFSGVFVRHPELKIVVVENEIGWLPFVLQQWDYYFHRFREQYPLGLDKPPSRYFEDNVRVTFFHDGVGTRMLGSWGIEQCMWSNDFPHPNSTWPRSREVVARDLGHLPEESRRRLLRDNACRLYDIDAPDRLPQESSRA